MGKKPIGLVIVAIVIVAADRSSRVRQTLKSLMVEEAQRQRLRRRKLRHLEPKIGYRDEGNAWAEEDAKEEAIGEETTFFKDKQSGSLVQRGKKSHLYSALRRILPAPSGCIS